MTKMSPEQIVLIIALFGSAKVAVDMVIGLFKRPPAHNKDRSTIEKLLRMTDLLDSKAEELMRRNQALEAEISRLKSSSKSPNPSKGNI